MDQSANPLAIKGINQLQYVTDDIDGDLHQLFLSLGFSPIAQSEQAMDRLYKQGTVFFHLTQVHADSSESEKIF